MIIKKFMDIYLVQEFMIMQKIYGQKNQKQLKVNPRKSIPILMS